jgi:hypothetical protein
VIPTTSTLGAAIELLDIEQVGRIEPRAFVFGKTATAAVNARSRRGHRYLNL